MKESLSQIISPTSVLAFIKNKININMAPTVQLLTRPNSTWFNKIYIIMVRLELPKKFEVVITRLKIGHTKISHIFLTAKKMPFSCEICIDINYIFTERRIYTQDRKNPKFPDSLIASFNQDPNSIAVLNKFIIAADLLNKIKLSLTIY